MTEKKLSEDLRRCLEYGVCRNCEFYPSQKATMVCEGLLQKAYKVVRRYEEMYEQGNIIKLPFTTGDEVWVIDENKKFRCKVIKVEICNQRKFAVVEKNMMYEENMGYIRVPIENFGKTVFLTRQEAEDKLAEMEGKK